MSLTLKDLMTPLPQTIGHDIPVKKAIAMMEEKDIRHLPVLEGGQLVGILSDRDLKIVEMVPGGDEVLTETLMTDEAIIVSPTTLVRDAITKMLTRKVSSLIVRAEGDQPWGIFTTTDALKYLAEKV